MRFRTRVFLLWLIPVAGLLSISFWMIQRMVQVTVHDGLRQSMRQNQTALNEAQALAAAHEQRFLKVAGENSALKASVQLLLVEGSTAATRATLEDQLQEFCGRMEIDLLAVVAPDHRLLGGVIRTGPVLRSLAGPHENDREIHAEGGFLEVGSEVYKTNGVPVELSGETVATLIVGSVFEFSQKSMSSVLLHGGRILRSSVPGVRPAELEAALRQCPGQSECDVQVAGRTFVSVPVSAVEAENPAGYRVISLQDSDSAIGPVRAGLRWVFISVFAIAALIAVFCGVISARSIVRPISALVTHLREAEQSGLMSALKVGGTGIREIDDLTRSFNQAALATSEAREKLDSAYLQFVGTLAKALDARDRYTAGHSQRVSLLACKLGAAMELPVADLERLRMGALLHDIGKIGISDTVLLKPGRLTDSEMAMIRQHPEIGRRILEKVQGFSAWLDAVELHHENWDGSGYPHGLRGECVPIDARIIHVADAYDAMTSDRPYRKGMGRERAMLNLQARAGADFDPVIVACLVRLSEAETPFDEPVAGDTAQLIFG